MVVFVFDKSSRVVDRHDKQTNEGIIRERHGV
jgi:hypothetical protein